MDAVVDVAVDVVVVLVVDGDTVVTSVDLCPSLDWLSSLPAALKDPFDVLMAIRSLAGKDRWVLKLKVANSREASTRRIAQAVKTALT